MNEPERWILQRISADDDVNQIDCGDEPWAIDVTDFLRDQALDEQSMGLNTTTLFNFDGNMVGFASLVASSLRMDKGNVEDARPPLEIPPELAEVGRTEFPCLLIGQFGVSRSFRGQGFGGQMLQWIRAEAYDMNVGIRFLTLHCARENRAGRAFWERNGFINVPRLGGGEVVFMWFDLYYS